MIELKLKGPMCNGCPNFEPTMKKTVFYINNEKAETDTAVVCTNQDLCDRIEAYLFDQLEKEWNSPD